MSVFNLATNEAREELVRILEGQIVKAGTLKKDPSGSDMLDMELLFDSGMRISCKVSSTKQFFVEADINLPQFVGGAGDTSPPSDEIFKLRVVK